MQKFTIKDVENACGIKAHTLRTWEQRYHLIARRTDASRQRFYDAVELKKILQVCFLVNNGWKVNKLADFTAEAFDNLWHNTQTEPHNYPAFIMQLLEATLSFDEQKFNQVLQEVSSILGLKECMLQVVYPLLQRIKLVWANYKTNTAQQVFATCIIQNKIITESNGLALSLVSKGSIVVFSPDKEYNNVHLLFINHLLKDSGWRTIYFGGNINWRHIQNAIEKKRVGAVYMHLVTNLTGFEVDDYLETLCKTFPEKQIIVSGAATQSVQRNFLNLRLLQSDTSIFSFATGDFISAARK